MQRILQMSEQKRRTAGMSESYAEALKKVTMENANWRKMEISCSCDNGRRAFMFRNLWQQYLDVSCLEAAVFCLLME